MEKALQKRRFECVTNLCLLDDMCVYEELPHPYDATYLSRGIVASSWFYKGWKDLKRVYDYEELVRITLIGDLFLHFPALILPYFLI